MQSITQVFGLLFGNGENEEQLEGSIRKRGRPIKYINKDKRALSSVKSSSSLDSMGNDSEEQQPRKRGRPKGTFKAKPRVVSSTGLRELNNLGTDSKRFSGTSFMKRKEVRSTRSSSCSDDNSDFDSDNDIDGGWGNRNSYARRSRRNKPLDPSKDLIVLRPTDDPVGRLGIGANEIGEFTVCMEEQGEQDDYEEQSGQQDPHDPIIVEGAEVHTPGVALIANQMEKYKRDNGISPKRSESERNKLRISVKNPSASYAEYEADSDDEVFVGEVKKKFMLNSSIESSNNKSKLPDYSVEKLSFSCYWFQKMISTLEREMEFSKSYLPLSFEGEDIRNNLEEFVETSEEALELANKYLNDEKDASFTDIQEYIEEYPPLKNTEQKRIGSENHLQALIRGNSSMSIKNDDNPLKNEENSWSSNRTAAIASLAYLNLSSNDSLSSIKNFNCKREWTTHFGVTRKSLETDPILFTYYTVDQLKKLVPEERAISLLSELLNQAYASSNQSPFAEKAQVSRTSAESQKKAFLLQIYNYWVDKRSKRRISLLRCYHNFIMDNWHQQQDCIPSLAEDQDTKSLENSHSKLLRLRRDLDRSRLIMDRVRRREKVKKDLIRIAGESNVANNENKFTLDMVEYENLVEVHHLNLTSFGSNRSIVETPFKKHERRGASEGDSAGAWIMDEDKLLLLGVSKLGVGRWCDIRDEYGIQRNSAQMNQRFTALVRRRTSKVNSKYKKVDDNDNDDEAAADDDDDQSSGFRKQLNKKIVKLIDDFDEEKVWEAIAIKYLSETGNQEKRSGRPCKYPIPIPIPKHLQPKITENKKGSGPEPVKVRVHHNQWTKKREREELARKELERLAALAEVKKESRRGVNQYTKGKVTSPVSKQNDKPREREREKEREKPKEKDNANAPPARRDQNGRFVSLKNKNPKSSSKNTAPIIIDKGSTKRGTDLSEKEIERMNKAHYEKVEMKIKEQKSEREKRARLRVETTDEEEPQTKLAKIIKSPDDHESPNGSNNSSKKSSANNTNTPRCSLGSLLANR